MARNVKRDLDELLVARGSVSASELAKRAGVSRQAAHHHLRAGVESGELERTGAGRATRYRARSSERPAGETVVFERSWVAGGLDEDAVWTAVASEPAIEAMSKTARDIAHYAVTELANNAIDHASAQTVSVRVASGPTGLTFSIGDDGVGVFQHVRRALGLDSAFEAIEQLHKGKTTTMPDRHTGEGLFFVSKAVDRFELASHGLVWVVDNDREDMSVIETEHRAGTIASVLVRPESTRRLQAVFDAWTDDFRFAKTRTVVRLFEHGVSFVSRSEAKRLLMGLERFSEVIVDFAGVAGVGQGFADEVFRVFAARHPEVKLVPVNMNDAVTFMVRRALRGADSRRL